MSEIIPRSTSVLSLSTVRFESVLLVSSILDSNPARFSLIEAKENSVFSVFAFNRCFIHFSVSSRFRSFRIKSPSSMIFFIASKKSRTPSSSPSARIGEDKIEANALRSSGARVCRPVSSCFFKRESALLIGENNSRAADSSAFNSFSDAANSVSSSLNRTHSSLSSIALNLSSSLRILFSSAEHSSS